MPQSLKNSPTPIGDTGIGLQGRKNRRNQKGEKKATPRPPSVIASRMPWEAVTNEKKAQSFQDRSGKKARAAPPARSAKTIECEKPRWPRASP